MTINMSEPIGKRIQMIRIQRSHAQVELAHRIGETLDTINTVSYTHLTLPTKRIV